MDKLVKLLVEGRVQGVFFRKSTQQEAHQLGLKGYVKNLPNGRVEIIAQGPKEKIDKLVSWAEEGPQAAQVKNIEREELDKDDFKEAFSDFKVIR